MYEHLKETIKAQEADKAKIQQAIGLGDIVQFNVRGKTEGFLTTMDNLTKAEGSLMSKMMKGEVPLKKINDAIFIDRNPNIIKINLVVLLEDLPKTPNLKQIIFLYK